MKTLKVYSPYDNRELSTVKLSSEKQVDEAIDLAYKYFNNDDGWLKKHEIVAIFEKTIAIMQEQVEALTLIAVDEGGKPYTDSKVEVYRAIDGIKVAIDEIRTMAGKEIPMGHTQSSAHTTAHTFFEPRGVVAAISAFNHPLNLAIHQIIPAIAVGAPVLIKPASSTPMSALHFVDILYEAGLPKALCQVLVCENEVAETLIKSPKIAFMTFIGSSRVGWYLNRNVADGTRVALEHGGVAPVIVEKSATLSTLIPAITKGGFYHAGQVCVSVQKVFVDEEIMVEVTEQLKASVMKLNVGDPRLPQTEVGPLISTKELKRIDTWVQDAIAEGATLVCGGKAISESLYEPTILLNPSQSSAVSKQEVFGPVICLYSYTDIEKAYDEANALDVAFQAAVFTNDINVSLRATRRLKATTVMVNEHTAFRVDWMPFSGAKHSGLGIGGIPSAMHEMSLEKLVVTKSAVF